MSTHDYRPSDSELADWTQRRDRLAAHLKNFQYPPDDAWLRELVIRHTEPMAEACRNLKQGVPINIRLSEAAAETDRHIKDKLLDAGKRAEEDIAYLQASMKRCLAAVDEWVKEHSR